MVTIDTFKKYALAFPEVTEEGHFEKTSFRVRKKIFATWEEKTNRACLKLTLPEQDVFSLPDNTVIYPVPNKWGKQGWTWVELNMVREKLFMEALLTAYCTVAPVTLARQVRPA